MIFWPFLHFLIFLVYVYLVIFILIRNPKATLNRVAAALISCFALWSLGMVFKHNPATSESLAMLVMNIDSTGWVSFSSFFLWFCLLFTEKRKILKTKIFYIGLFVIPILFIYKQWTNSMVSDVFEEPYGWGYAWSDSIWPYLYFLYFTLFCLSGIILLFNFMKKTKNPVKKKQSKIIFVAAMISFVVGGLLDIVLLELEIFESPGIGSMSTLVLMVGIVYSIARYKFLVITPAMAADNIVSTMMDSLILLDPKGNIVTVNKAALDLLGYQEEDLEGKSISLLFADTDQKEDLLEIILRGQLIRDYELTFKTKDQRNIPVMFSNSVLKDEGDAIAGIVCIAHDITERKRKEQELHEAKELAESASRFKSQFLASMSHELRTPLNAIIGFSEILRDRVFGELNEKQVRYADNILKSGRHLLQMINDILDLSKIEAGKMELELSRVRVAELLENSMIVIKEKCMKHGISLDLKIPQNLAGLEIIADERKLKQVMFNLLSNAAKFTPDGGAITITAQGDGKEISISVSDTGIGIKKEDQERIFGEFEQVKHSFDHMRQGTGLGLALTRKLVELHKGRIWVESEGEGKGSTFTFAIPVRLEGEKKENSRERKAVE